MVIQAQIIAAGVVLAMAFGAGWEVNGWRKDAQINAMQGRALDAADEARSKNRIIESLQDHRARIAGELEVERQKEAEIIERIVVTEVIKYVKTDNAIQCGMDDAGVRVHDIAASGRVSETTTTTSPPDDSPGGVTNAEVIQVVTQNYQVCHATRRQLIALQDWIIAVRVDSVSF